jgi:hypothetical protein
MNGLKKIDWQYIDNMGFLAIVSFFMMGLIIMILHIVNNALLKFMFWILDMGIKNAIMLIGKEGLLLVIPVVAIWIFVVIYDKIAGEEV